MEASVSQVPHRQGLSEVGFRREAEAARVYVGTGGCGDEDAGALCLSWWKFRSFSRDEDKHKAPAASPLSPLSLRTFISAISPELGQGHVFRRFSPFDKDKHKAPSASPLSPLSLRTYTSSLCGLLALLVMLVGCGGGGSVSSVPDAKTLIKQAQVAIQKVTSYHFNLAVDNPGTGGTLIIKTADGDILVPDKLKAKANVLILGNVVQVQLITIGSNQYVTDPITNQWQRTTGLLDPRTLSDSKTGVAAILGNIQNPTTPVDSNVNGTPCWSIDGTLDAKYLAAITGGGAPTGSIVKVTTCIGKADSLPYLIKMTGVAAAGDTSQTVRTFKLSKFNESLTITAPI